MKCFVGLDVSSKKLDVCFLDDEQETLLELSCLNDLDGATIVKEKILALNERHEFQKIVIGMESTSMYHFHPSMFFQFDEELNELPVNVTVLNPYNVNLHAKQKDWDKTDKYDARVIADFLRAYPQKVTPVKEEVYMALQRLTRTRYQIVQQLVQAKQHFLENLFYKCNTLTRELETQKTSVFGSTMIELITEELSLDEFAQMPLEDAVQLLQKHGRNRFKEPEKLVKAIQKAVRSSYRLGKVASDSVDLVLGVLAQEIRMLNVQLNELENGIEKLLETIPEAQSLLSIKGVGPVYAAGILAEIGQIERFESHAQLAKYVGLAWKKHQSGEYSSENTPRTKKGNRYLRYYFIEATGSVIRFLPEFRDYYTWKKKEVPKHQHKRALVLTTRKFLRLVDALLRNHQFYAPERRNVET